MALRDLTPEVAKRLGYEDEKGVIIADVKQGSLAERVGLKQGDLIIRVNQQRVSNIADLRKVMEKAQHRLLLLVRSGNAARFIAIPLPKKNK